MKCTATFTTATVEPCDIANSPGRTHGGCPCFRVEHQGTVVLDEVVHHVTLHTFECTKDTEHDGWMNGHSNVDVAWMDWLKGATPHAVSLVSDAEVEAAEAYLSKHGREPSGPSVRELLEAAAKVREAQT